MLLGRDLAAAQRIARRHRRQQAAVLVVLRRIVPAFLIELEEAVEGDGRAGGAKPDLLVGGCEVGDHAIEHGARHLARHGALPDQLVQPALVVLEQTPDRLGRAPEIGRPDRLVRLLGVLGPGAIGARLVRQVALAVGLRDLAPAGRERLARELDAVGAHVGDQADRLAVQIDALEQALGGAHGAIGAEAELARRLLLQGGGRERRRRMALDLLLLDALDPERARLDRRDRAPGVGLARRDRTSPASCRRAGSGAPGTSAPCGVVNAAWMLQYSCARNASISASRSQIRRSATDCTRPAEREPWSLRQSTGDRVKPTR